MCGPTEVVMLHYIRGQGKLHKLFEILLYERITCSPPIYLCTYFICKKNRFRNIYSICNCNLVLYYFLRKLFQCRQLRAPLVCSYMPLIYSNNHDLGVFWFFPPLSFLFFFFFSFLFFLKLFWRTSLLSCTTRYPDSSIIFLRISCFSKQT